MVEGGHEAGKVGIGEISEQEGGELLIFGVHRHGGGPALLGELDQRRAPVSRMRAALHEPVRIKGVAETGHVARGALQCLAQLTLRQPALVPLPASSAVTSAPFSGGCGGLCPLFLSSDRASCMICPAVPVQSAAGKTALTPCGSEM